MSRNRLEAFSDGVLAIVITIMVLEMKVPKAFELSVLKDMLPIFLAYVVSYIYIGIYWTNHHHLINVLSTVSGKVLWKNLHWLFWMTLIPIATEWTGLNPLEKSPALLYGLILLMCAISYNILQTEVVKISGKDSKIAKQIGKDIKGKSSITAYALGIIASFYLPFVSYLIYTIIALLWIVPDKRLEKAIEK